MTTLALSVQLDAFTKVKKAIDKMVKELSEAKKVEVMERDSCINQLNENQRFTEKNEREKSDLQSQLDGLSASIQELSNAVQVLQDEIKEMSVQMKRAGEDREKENADFQMTLADQRETQKLLNKALAVIKAVYAKKSTGLLQLKSVRAHTTQEPAPAGFKEYRKSAGAGGVLQLISQIINDAKHMETIALKDEQSAQEKYESFVKGTNSAVEQKRQNIVNKNQDKAEAEVKLEAAKTDLQSETEELNTLVNGAANLHQSCDFLLKNFEVRQEGFDQEIEALQQAKAILSGMGSVA